MAVASDQGPQRILEGVKVLDFTQYLAGPTVTRLMTELGAEVVKVEMAPGERAAHYGVDLSVRTRRWTPRVRRGRLR